MFFVVDRVHWSGEKYDPNALDTVKLPENCNQVIF